MIAHYFKKLRAADREWSERRANLDDSPDFFSPSVKLAGTIFLIGLGTALVGIFYYAGWL